MGPESGSLGDLIANAVQLNATWRNSQDRNYKWTDEVFAFTRQMRFHPELENLDGRVAAGVVEAELAKFFGVKDDLDPWTCLSAKQIGTRDNFIRDWYTIKLPIAFDDPLNEAVRRTEQEHELVTCSTYHLGSYRASFRKLISIACHLQEIVGQGQPIMLPTERLEGILELSHQRVSAMRTKAVAKGILQIQKPYRSARSGKGQATTYLVVVDYWPVSPPCT